MKNLLSPKKAVIILSFFCSAMVSAHTIDNGVLIIDEGTTALEPREFYGNTEITSIFIDQDRQSGFLRMHRID